MSRPQLVRPRSLVLLLALALGAAALVPLGAVADAATRPAASAAAITPLTSSAQVRTVRRTPKWRTIDRVVPVKTGPKNDIAIGIDTRLYVPRSATRRHPQPAILMTHGFGLEKTSNEVVSTARFLAAHGYVVLTYSSSGFGDSGGCVTLQSADYDVKSASQLITAVLSTRRDVKRDRRGVVVGTIGGSYGGGIQLPLAAADRRVRTSVVGRTWNNLLYSLNPNNRVVPGDPTGFSHELNQQGVFKQQWTSLFYALGNAQPASGKGGCPEAKTASQDPVEIAGAPGCPGYYLALCRTASLLTSTGDADAESRTLVARASASTFMNRINIPVLLVQGQSDTLFNLNDATATYTALKRRRVPVGMIWNSGGHGGYTSQPGECEAYDGTARSVRAMNRCYLPQRSLGWLDHWLRGTRAGRGPSFSYYRDWVKYAGRGPNDEQYGTSARFPLRRSTTTFTLSGSGTLAAPGAAVVAGSASFVNPAGGSPAAYSETSNFSGPDSSPSSSDVPPEEVAGQFAAFTSRPFRKPFAAVGIPSARLKITNSNGRDMVFFAKVYDEAPDGKLTLIHRLIAPVRVPAGAVGEPVNLKFAGFAHRFAAGHRVRLVLCSTDQTSYNAKVADVLTVATGAGSTFTLPGRLG